MATRVRVQVSLAKAIADRLESAVASGVYRTPSAAVEKALRNLLVAGGGSAGVTPRRRTTVRTGAEMEAAALRGLRSGRPIRVDDAMWEGVRAEVKKRGEARRRGVTRKSA